jgi:cell division protein FtsQ
MKILYTPGAEETQKVNRRKPVKKQRDWKEGLIRLCNRVMVIGFLVFILVVIGDIVCFVWKSPYFRVDKVILNTQNHLDKNELIRNTGLGQSIHLVRYPASRLKKYILLNPWVSNVTVEKEYPSQIRVNIKERVPVAMVVGKENWGIDAQGDLLPGLQIDAARQLPLISLGDQWEPGTTYRKNNPAVENALSILAHIKKEKPELLILISEIDITQPDNILLILQPEGTEVRMGNENIPGRLQNFYKTIEMAREQQMVLEYMDLRYDEQGIVTKPRNAHFVKPQGQTGITPST